jgi:leader peptidase (prepilin peptidase) / N-methyltransferase
VLLVLTAYDLVERRIPNRIVLPATAVLLLGHVWLDSGRTVEFVLAAVLAALFLLLPLFIYPAGMGMGDVKMALLLGAGLGSAVLAALFAGLFASFFAALFLLATRGRAARKTAIPFAPFLAFGGLVALFFS